jgi:hypothetical protein
MAIDPTLWQVNTDKSITYSGGDHGTATANYITVLELHRWLMDIADDASVLDHGDDDFMDITTINPSDKSFDTIINLVNGYYLAETGGTPAVEFVYGGTIIQNPGTGEQYYDGVRVVSNRGVKVNVFQNGSVLTNDFWNSVPNSEKTAATATVSTGSAGTTVEVSSTSEFAPGDVIMFGTVTDEVYMIDSITDANTFEVTETLTTPPTNGNAIYFATRGINPDPANGVAAQFMVKTRDSGANIDNTTLFFTTREWFYTYSQFRIPVMSRGQNVVPLTYALDLNNTTALAVASTWSAITNVTAGFNLIDVDDNSVNEAYYSEWDRSTFSINQFYERMKYLSRAGESATTDTYGIEGEYFRGITHSIETGAESGGSWVEGGATPLSWGSGATAGTAQILANDANILYVQLLTGVVPGNSVTVTQGAVSATTVASNAVLEKTISDPFCGASTGSAIVGAYGFSLELSDLQVNDKIQALDGITRSPPNIVQFTVNGVAAGYRVLVAPEDGAGGLDYDQLSVDGAVNGGAVTSITFVEARPANTPSSGTLRLQNSDGKYTRHTYTVTQDSPLVVTIPSHDFSGVGDDLVNGANAFITYIDRAAVGISESYSTVQTTVQTLYIEARFGGTGPDYTDAIKPAATTGTLGTTGGSATLSPISDA